MQLPWKSQAKPVAPAVEPALPPASLAWYGKLPSAGDFVSRHMPYALQQFWDSWCANGMEALKADNPVHGFEVWRGAPKWAFLLPAQPGISTGQLGVFAPSCDRVGRNFPFLVTAPLISQQLPDLLPRAAMLALAWGEVIAQEQENRQGIDAVDLQLQAALATTLATTVLADDAERTLPQGMNPVTTPWPDLAWTFDLYGPQSYWWSVPPTTTGFQARTQTGSLKAMHFLALCQ
jgi:type VI secretion system protein ImpM